MIDTVDKCIKYWIDLIYSTIEMYKIYGLVIYIQSSIKKGDRIRELLGTGALTFWVTPIQIFGPSFKPFSFMVEAPGAFMALGLMLCLMNLAGKK